MPLGLGLPAEPSDATIRTPAAQAEDTSLLCYARSVKPDKPWHSITPHDERRSCSHPAIRGSSLNAFCITLAVMGYGVSAIGRVFKTIRMRGFRSVMKLAGFPSLMAGATVKPSDRTKAADFH